MKRAMHEFALPGPTKTPRCMMACTPRLAMSLILALSVALLGCSPKQEELRSDAEISRTSGSARSQIEHLTLASSGVTDLGVRELSTFSALQTVWFRGCDSVTDLGFAALEVSRELRCISVWNCKELGQDSARAWQHLDLKSFIVTRTAVDDEVLRVIARMPRLEEVLLSEVTGVTDGGVAALAASPNLLSLVVVACPGVSARAADGARSDLRVTIRGSLR